MIKVKETFVDGTVKYSEREGSLEYKPLSNREGIESVVTDDNGFSAIKQTREWLTLFTSSEKQ